MVNWQKFKVLCTPMWKEEIEAFEFIGFSLDKYFDCGNYSEKTNIIFCVNRSPFNTWKVGDYLEIDLDGTIMLKKNHVFDDINVVRKFNEISSSSSMSMTIGSTTITRQQGLAIAQELDAMVDQSGGTKEYTASIEVQDNQGRPIKFSLSSKKAN